MVNSSLINLAYSLKASGHEDDVIVNSLKIIGFEKADAEEALKQIAKKNTPVLEEKVTTFSISDLYLAANKVVSVLENMSSDSNFGFSAVRAKNIINSIFNNTIELKIQNILENKCSEKDADVAPTLKYSIAETLYSALQESENLDIVREFRGILLESYNTDKYGYLASHAIQSLSKSTNKADMKFCEGLNAYLLKDSHNEKDLKALLLENQWSQIAQYALRHFKEETKVNKLDECDVFSIVSPVYKINEGIVFNITGKNYVYNGSTVEVSKSEVKDINYNNVLAGLGCMQYEPKNQSFVYEGINGKILTYDTHKDRITINDLILNSNSILAIAESLKASGIFDSVANAKDYELILKMFESRGMIQNIDVCKIVMPKTFNGRFCTIFEEANHNLKVNYINENNSTSETKNYNLASNVVSSVKEFLNCDITKIFESRLIQENDEKSIRDAEITEISKVLDKLYEKRNQISEAYNQLKDESLNEALKLINIEVKKLEKQLQESYI